MKQSLAIAYATKRRARTKIVQEAPEETIDWGDEPTEVEAPEASNKPNLSNIIQKMRKQKLTQNED